MNCSMPASLSFTISWSLLKLMSTESLMPSNYPILCFPFSYCPQHQGLFPATRSFSMNQLFASSGQNWNFSFSVSHSNEYSGLISFRTNWFDRLAVQGILKSLLQLHSLKASVLRCLAFFIIQPSYPFMSIGKTIALTIWTLSAK